MTGILHFSQRYCIFASFMHGVGMWHFHGAKQTRSYYFNEWQMTELNGQRSRCLRRRGGRLVPGSCHDCVRHDLVKRMVLGRFILWADNCCFEVR